MTGRERVLAALHRSGPDRVPVCDAFWEDTLARWHSEGLPADTTPAEFFDFDIAPMSVDASPRFPAELLDEDADTVTMRDRFGYVARKARGKSRTVEYLSVPLEEHSNWPAVKERFTLPEDEPARIDTTAYPFRLEPDISWDEARARHAALRARDKYILAGAYGPNEATWRLLGFTQNLFTMMEKPDFTAEIAGTYIDFLIRVLDRCIAEGTKPDGFFMIEDLASTRAMLFSPAMWRTLYKPLVARLGDFLRSNGLHFWMHCCGDAEPIFDDLIECGLEVIQPLEAKSGLDVRLLKDRYGGRLTFYGNINIITMADSEAAIEAEIRDKLAPFSDGGYIYHSDHSVPPEVSFDRYRFVIDCVRRYGAGA